MTVRTKILLLSSIAFLAFFLFAVIETGQNLLSAKPHLPLSSNATDIAARAGFTPAVYGIVPFALLLLCGLISWFIDSRSK